ncbi:MAG TPA: thiol peroxidase [Desulfohalobiaceae bacterium]|nr:thiol peroxidase [Desulfohalobiaceae bacterium]
MQERSGIIKMNGDPLTLLGPEIRIGDKAPEFQSVNTDLQPIGLKDLQQKILVLSSVPSLDTSVCDMETRRFNNEATNLSSDIAIVTISMDLPFAQKRWCGATGVDRVLTLSDYQQASFGHSYGLLIKELRLLTRAVLILDKQRIVQYIQLVPELTQEPEYESILNKANDLLSE